MAYSSAVISNLNGRIQPVYFVYIAKFSRAEVKSRNSFAKAFCVDDLLMTTIESACVQYTVCLVLVCAGTPSIGPPSVSVNLGIRINLKLRLPQPFSGPRLPIASIVPRASDSQ